MHTFTVYKTETCPYSRSAMQFLDGLRSDRDDVDVRLIDADAHPDKFQKVAQQVRRDTVPQIFLDGMHIGGWDDLARAAKRGQLDGYFATGQWKEPDSGRRPGLIARLFGSKD